MKRESLGKKSKACASTKKALPRHFCDLLCKDRVNMRCLCVAFAVNIKCVRANRSKDATGTESDVHDTMRIEWEKRAADVNFDAADIGTVSFLFSCQG